MRFPTLLACGLLAGAARAATPAEWRSRSIYQIITDRFARTDGSTTAACNSENARYCGGTFNGIMDKLDYIQGMGFSAIWISPVTLNLEGVTPYGEAYHGYWQQDLYRINPHFGSADELKALSAELHRRGMFLMVDIVVNHNGWNGPLDTVDYSRLSPFNSSDYYHPYCTIDYNNQDTVEDCWLGDTKVMLPDLITENPTVAGTYNAWINELVSVFSIDGLRIDTAKHVDKPFFPGFIKAAGVFATGEVFHPDAGYTCNYQNYMPSVLNYPVWYALINAFSSTSGPLNLLNDAIEAVKSACRDTSLLGSFSENHDNARFPSITKDWSLVQNLLAFTILADGIPIVYQGQEQHYAGGADPYNREALWFSGYNTSAPLYHLVARLNSIRARAATIDPSYLAYRNWIVYSDPSHIAMRKGPDGTQVFTVLSNEGAAGETYTLSLGNHGWETGTQLVEVLTCTTVAVGAGGNLDVPMVAGLPRVFYARSLLEGSGLCVA